MSNLNCIKLLIVRFILHAIERIVCWYIFVFKVKAIVSNASGIIFRPIRPEIQGTIENIHTLQCTEISCTMCVFHTQYNLHLRTARVI